MIIHIYIILCFILYNLIKRQYNIETFQNYSNIFVYVINLDRNNERLMRFMKNYNIFENKKIERFSAINGKELSYDYLSKVTTNDVLEGIKLIDITRERKFENQLTRGMIGCYLSHIKIYENALIRKRNNLLILEDDADITLDIIKNINFEDFPRDWDIILVGWVNIFKKENITEKVDKIYNFWGTHCYFINKNGMKKMLKECIPIIMQIDYYMSKLANDGAINIYGYKKNMILQNSIYSDVQMVVR